MKTLYPHYDVLDKWDSPSFDDKTRNVLHKRLHRIPPRRFLSEDEWMLLDAIVARVMPQKDRPAPIPITPWIDDMLAAGRGEGFRHDNMPRLREAWRLGLAAIDAESHQRYGYGFVELDDASSEALFRALEQDRGEPTLWRRLPAQRFFINVLVKTIAGIYYSHPDAWSEVGFGGPASPRGYVRLGFNERDAWDAKEVR